jgi:hypothetical protein
MSHMTVNQRNQFERIDLSVPSTGVHVSDRRRIIATNIVALAVVGLLGYATIERLDSWPRAIVLGFIVLTVIGAMMALSPARRS